MGIGLRRGDADLLRWLNTEIFLLGANKEIQALQQKWMKTVNKELPAVLTRIGRPAIGTAC